VNVDLGRPARIFEINARCWLEELRLIHGPEVHLGTIPDEILDEWIDWGFTHIWLMGVWTTGPRSRRLAASALLRHHAGTGDRAEPPAKPDIPGSPYAIARYAVPRRLGGDRALAQLRRRLNARGLRLILDFVPNHVGLDHPWLRSRPELFIRSASPLPEMFAAPGQPGCWIAHGKDPYFPAWNDTAQLDYRCAETHQAMREVLHSLAARCDGLRCDMAMLLLNHIFTRNWARIPGKQTAPSEFWERAIREIKSLVPGFQFIGEVYWDCEAALQALGFDYTYDKSIYDLLMSNPAAGIQRYLSSRSAAFHQASLHFLENHDEIRVASALALEQHRAAAFLVFGLPGMALVHDGQLTGAVHRVPVQLGCRPRHPVNPAIQALYREVFVALTTHGIGRGTGSVPRVLPADVGDETFQFLGSILWRVTSSECVLLVVNLAVKSSRGVIELGEGNLPGGAWNFRAFSSETGADQVQILGNTRIFVELGALGVCILKARTTAPVPGQDSPI
jgi:hypothetical protein